MRSKFKFLSTLVLLSMSLLTSGQTNLQKVRLGVHWQPQAQFAGYYIGIEKSIYKKYGLDIELFHASPSITSQEMLLDGKVDYASMFLSTAMYLRSNDEPIVNICQLSQHSAQLLVTKDTTINKPEDLNGKKIGVWRSGFDELLRALVKKYDLKIEYVPINSTINLFLFGGIDVQTVMWYNEYHTILNAGINKDELNTLFFADFGFDIPEDGIYCLEKNLNKETIRKFKKATLEAWDYTFAHREEAIDLVEKEMALKHVPFNKAHQNWMLDRMYDLFKVKNEGDQPGELLKVDFQDAFYLFNYIGEIENKINYEDFYYGIE